MLSSLFAVEMRKLVLILGFILSTQIGFTQHSCGTDLYYQQQLAKDPNIKSREISSNQEIKALRVSKTIEKRAAKYKIPVVFHVIHTGGPENISREQILDQIRILNEDYSYTNANKKNLRAAFTNVAGSADIQFELAKIDPNGKCFDGVNRIYSPQGVDMDMTSEPVKKLAYWDYKKYLNVWVVTNITEGSGTGTVLGYAVFPFATGGTTRDGIVIRHDRVGSIGTAAGTDDGRTLTHEVGHWLGLFHTFQGGCSDGDNCDDTPPVEGTFTNANCPANGNSCSTDSPNLPDMWENYMDYSNGKCMAAFTFQQIDIMNYYLTRSPRNSNVAASNLLATGVSGQNVAPVAEFTASSQIACAGQPIKFYDLSCKGIPTVRSWTFKGAATPSSTLESPEVIYQSPGTYEVALTVQNSYGTNSISKTGYITILPAVSQGQPSFEEGFENGDPTTLSGFVHQSPPATRFQVTQNAAYTGSKSYVANITTGSTPGTVYSFTTKSFDISQIPTGTTPKFTFYCSYVQPNANVSETMRLYISTDCGGTFEKIWERTGSALAYSVSAPYASNFKPTSKAEWKRQGLASLSSLGFGTAKNAIFRIDVLSGGGNPVYIDNINMSQWYAGNNLFNESQMKVELKPNPALSATNLSFETSIPLENTKITLYDVQGRMVQNYFQGDLNVGKHEFEIEAPNNRNFGLYYLKVENSNGSFTRAIVFGNE